MEKWRKGTDHSVENLMGGGRGGGSVVEKRRMTVGDRYSKKFSLRKGRGALGGRANPENPKEAAGEKQLIQLMGH